MDDKTMRDLMDGDGENRAVRTFLQLYGCTTSPSIEGMRDHLTESGFEGCWPEWAGTQFGFLTKGGAQDWLRHLFGLEATEPHDCSGLDKLRERLEACDQDRPMLVHPTLVDDLFDKIDMLRQILDAERAALPPVQAPDGNMSEAMRMLDSVIPFRLSRIEKGECIDASVAVIRSALETIRAALPAVQVPQWISVEEGLPEIDFSKQGYAHNVRVLAAWGSKPENVAEMDYRSNAYAKTEKGRAPRFEWQGKVSPWPVTHWMPLPPPPATPSQGDE